MVLIQGKSKRKPSGARYKSKINKKRKALIGRHPAMTKIGERKIQKIRGRGGIIKHRALYIKKVNLYDPKTKTYSYEDIKNVIENPADKNFIRRKIITKGAIIETSKGIAKITNRPGQEGIVNAVLIDNNLQ